MRRSIISRSSSSSSFIFSSSFSKTSPTTTTFSSLSRRSRRIWTFATTTTIITKKQRLIINTRRYTDSATAGAWRTAPASSSSILSLSWNKYLYFDLHHPKQEEHNIMIGGGWWSTTKLLFHTYAVLMFVTQVQQSSSFSSRSNSRGGGGGGSSNKRKINTNNNNNNNNKANGRNGSSRNRSPPLEDLPSSSSSSFQRKKKTKQNGGNSKSLSFQKQQQQQRRGRQRYDSTGNNNKKNNKRDNNDKDISTSPATSYELPPPPPLTDIHHGPFPTYYTCRHTYEETLIEELTTRIYNKNDGDDDSTTTTTTVPEMTSPCPGLVRVEGSLLLQPTTSSSSDSKETTTIITYYDPIYALQIIPNCHVVECINSIKGLARVIVDTITTTNHELLSMAPKGTLTIHSLVPGMMKGQKDPILQRRCILIGKTVLEILKQKYPTARRNNNNNNNNSSDIQLLLQILLFSPDVAAISLSQCQQHPISISSSSSLTLTSTSVSTTSTSTSTGGCWWPNIYYPVGMALVDITNIKMPSSAYRKLLEALACLGGGIHRPSTTDTIVDLGASPGGWTAALLLYCDNSYNNNKKNTKNSDENDNENDYSNNKDKRIHIIAIDRSPLSSSLMKDERVTMIQGDAFTYQPTNTRTTWMVCDIIAYPERIIDLLHLWCSNNPNINYMIITMKFQGTTPSWIEIDTAIQVVTSYNYIIRMKHFFNNKNEITLLLRKKEISTTTIESSSSFVATENDDGDSDGLDPSQSVIPSFYKPVLLSSTLPK